MDTPPAIPEEAPEDSSSGLLSRILQIIRTIIDGGRSFLSFKMQLILEFISSVLDSLVGGSSSTGSRSDGGGDRGVGGGIRTTTIATDAEVVSSARQIGK